MSGIKIGVWKELGKRKFFMSVSLSHGHLLGCSVRGRREDGTRGALPFTWVIPERSHLALRTILHGMYVCSILKMGYWSLERLLSLSTIKQVWRSPTLKHLAFALRKSPSWYTGEITNQALGEIVRLEVIHALPVLRFEAFSFWGICGVALWLGTCGLDSILLCWSPDSVMHDGWIISGKWLPVWMQDGSVCKNDYKHSRHFG